MTKVGLFVAVKRREVEGVRKKDTTESE